MHPNANPFEQAKFNQTLLVDAFGQSYMFLPRHVSYVPNSGELIHHHIDTYWAQSLLQNHSPMWGYQFDLNKLYFQVSGDYMAGHKSEQQKIAWLSNGIVSGEVKVLKGANFAPPPPSNMEGGMPVAALPESVVTRAKPAQKPLGQGGQSTEDIREALDLYCALPDGSPAANLPYKATLADGTVLKGMLDADGLAHLPNLKPNNVDVEFGEQPNDAAIAATRAEITAVLSSIITAERAEGAKIAAEYGELNALEKGVSSIGSLLTGIGGALSDTAEFTYNLIELGSMQGQLKRALNAGWDAYNVEDNDSWATSFANNWTAQQHQAYVKALGFDPASITKENLTEAYEIASFISDDDETQTALLQFVKDFADAQHHTELTEMGGAAIFDIVLGAVLVALTGGAGTAAVAANKVRHLDKLGGLFKKLAKQLKQKARFKTQSGRTGGKVEQQIAKPAGAQVSTDAAKQKPANHKPKRISPVQTIDEAEKRLSKAKDAIAEARASNSPLPKTPYTLEDKLNIVENGLNENVLVRIIETGHSKDSGTIGQVKNGRAVTWTAPMSQVEHADSDAKLILNAFGTRYDPNKNYTMLLIDNQQLADAGDVVSIIPTFDNINKIIANNPDMGIDPSIAKRVMNEDFAPKYEDFANKAWEAGIDMNNPIKRREYAEALGYDAETIGLLSERHDIATKISAWEIFTGNGMTRDTNVVGKVAYGPVEVFTYDRNPQQLGKLEDLGAIKRINL
ncbi:hypothetical protein [Agarivorans gilvus]|uniref:hypothetical protein n=1 Tax=Agarivorans gilvus TaxID=680279 RepID=UPI0006EBE4D4|nr:hypothetical protein [Agarivorans gilvus]